MTMMWGEATAQSGCTSALMGLTPCLGFIQGGLSNPSSSCCSGLASVVKSQAACLCQVLNGGGSSFGVTINQTQALALPGACKVQTPPVSECNAVNKPSEAPAGSPVGSPTGAPADALAPEGDDQSNTSTFSSSPSAAQSSSSNGCNSVIMTLAPCLDYIEAKSSSPSSSCCTQLGGVIKTQPQCLCEVMASSGSPAGVKINKTQAMTLPSACKVQAPPLSQCSGAAGSGKGILSFWIISYVLTELHFKVIKSNLLRLN
ncbi:hypothetical protein Cgig2_033157 [Carnegiea gigantea]|uniref:Bifunctional inhibitor/plant lipid transfer protein/seed storage helical domain-containing protein n=1 Tax=Carnegiea gigantea TaxID=171969 RepID=A0A9Q1JJY1_9CARY|nr:hypothetical protein Cgig2_033157 [Carnegiea gigantea]